LRTAPDYFDASLSRCVFLCCCSYPFVATMVETFSVERRKLIRFMGGKVILTPGAERGTGMVRGSACASGARGAANQSRWRDSDAQAPCGRLRRCCRAVHRARRPNVLRLSQPTSPT